ncbi:uncharacterized protein HMPREF1541_06418 [Cyphellophora europaea CBS 101466]|uniref:Uncharacterized protein n=1 Tax=Cyphellophora europaea (strain CBS 101466) TaxID=1220924 RepID=W2RRN8_CYPE1|nr:uncharacterized protein HMPREF1541_06418 [Cyphellophora europaea CBS 101466]ETN38383.1 hypothetical protein HMPREF1541_06418 [Cyphellophora europaea CBS 101466]
MPLFGGGSKADDPFYHRKPVPDEFIQDVAPSGLSAQEEWANRERKMSINGVDIRKFSNSRSSGMEPQDDPYYGRKSVTKAEIDGVAPSGMTEEEEYANRERKMSVNGVDLRKFSLTPNGGFKPQNDPYYARKAVDKAQTKGIAETDNTPAQDYAVRERKMSAVNFSSDPFQLITGTGHRQSVSTASALNTATAATERRRSSAIAPDAAKAAAAHHHSGYDGQHLEPIQSRVDGESSTTGISHGESSTTTGVSHGGESSTFGINQGESSSFGFNHAGSSSGINGAGVGAGTGTGTGGFGDGFASAHHQTTTTGSGAVNEPLDLAPDQRA